MHGPSHPDRSFRSRYVVAAVLWCVTALAVKPFLAYLDFGAFYSTAIERILMGTPLDLYGFAARPPGSDLANPLCNPPVWFFFLAPLYALGSALGIADFHRQAGISVGQAWMLLASLPLDLLLCRMVLRVAEGGERMAEPRRLCFFLCLLFSPLLWLSSVRFQHNEAAMILLVLLAVAAGERGRSIASGAFWGLALGLKTTAIVPALVCFGWGLGPGRRRATGVAALVAIAVFAGPLLPYFLFREELVTYALFGFERLRPVGGYTLWKLLPDPDSAASYANALILVLSAALGLFMSRRRGRTFLSAGGDWALVMGQIFLLALGKGIHIWYTLPISVFLYLAAARQGKAGSTIPMFPLFASLSLWALQGGAWVGDSTAPSVRTWSTIWVALLLGLAACATRNLLRPDPRTRPDMPVPGVVAKGRAGQYAQSSPV